MERVPGGIILSELRFCGLDDLHVNVELLFGGNMLVAEERVMEWVVWCPRVLGKSVREMD